MNQYAPTVPAQLTEDPRDKVERDYADYLQSVEVRGTEGIAHCDELVLHATGVCEFCDEYPQRQALRRKLRIAFTGDGTYPLTSHRPCPAEVLRPVETIERWGGNVPETAERRAGREKWARELDEMIAKHPGVIGPSLDDPEIDEARERLNLHLVELRPQGEVTQHAFNRAVDETIARTQGVSSQRGGEYQDTWALENIETTFVSHVLRMKGIPTDDREWLRLLACAALIDVKDARMLGPWKQDSVDDGINYRAAFAAWREEYGK